MPRTDPTGSTPGLLRVLARGPASAAELATALGVSQPTVSRAVRASATEVLVVGRARATRYAARRRLEGVRSPVPVYEVRPRGSSPRRLVDLHPVRPDGFWAGLGAAGEFHDDLPWFLQDVRPSGFLGRLLPRRFPELELPTDIRLWSGDQTLRYAVGHGWNLPGALVLGDRAYETFLAAVERPPDAVDAAARDRRYPELAADVLQLGPAGSSAGGEQPKFLATRSGGDGLVPVLVKFSPPLRDDVAVRIGDLLVAEHVAHEVLAARGVPTARSSLLWAGDRVFLEVERFDREGTAHRRGLVTLAAVDGQFVGSNLDRWSTTTASLVRDGLLSAGDHAAVRWLETFGRMIANTEMHASNLSLFLDGARIVGPAQAYDMAPALYAPVQGEVVPRTFAPALPAPSDADVARGAWAAARDYWASLAERPEVSSAFREVARRNLGAVAALEPTLQRLPS